MCVETSHTYYSPIVEDSPVSVLHTLTSQRCSTIFKFCIFVPLWMFEMRDFCPAAGLRPAYSSVIIYSLFIF